MLHFILNFFYYNSHVQGAKNCPFLTLIILPFLQLQLINQFVYIRMLVFEVRLLLATIEHCSAACTSVRTGTPTSFLILSNIGNDLSHPKPLLPFKLVLLALSKEVL